MMNFTNNMDIKEKFRSFIDKQKTSLKPPVSPILSNAENITIEDLQNQLRVLSLNQRKSEIFPDQILTPEAEQAVIDSIDHIYFENDGDDVGEHELKKFPDIADIHVISGMRSRLRKQQAIVSRRVSSLIMQKQVLCSEENDKVTALQKEVYKTISLCVESRKSLSQGRNQFTSASLGILSNYSKRQSVASVIRSLRTIKTLQMTDVQLQNLLKAEDYPGAIQLLLECQKATATFKHFTCISELSTKLQDTLESAEEQLDIAVSKVAINFNAVNYEKLYIAYDLLGKTQTMMDQLHMHLTSHIHNSAFTIVLGYVELYNSMNCEPNNTNALLCSKMQYSELCKYINEECFLSCFLDLSKALWGVLRSYKNILKWHQERETIIGATGNKSDSETIACKKYIKQKLDHGLVRIWQDVQAKVRMFILASDLSHFKFDDFLRVLDVINKLIEVGEVFCGSKSETLHESIKKQSINFFRTHHQARMEELHMFLENEGWEICPVKSTFSINQLLEFRFLRSPYSSTNKTITPNSSPVKKSSNIPTIDKDVFTTYDKDGTPFDIQAEDSVEEDIMENDDTSMMTGLSDDDSDEDVPDELKRDFVDELTGEDPHQFVKRKSSDSGKGVIVTNTTLTVLRLIGKYIQMMQLLQPIAFDVTICLSQLFDYYLYTVFLLFGTRGDLDPNISPRLRTALKKIEEALILNTESENEENNFVNRVPAPALSPIVNIESVDNLYGLPVCVVAIESLCFLSKQLETLQIPIESLLPASKKTFLLQFYGGTVKITSEVRHHVYMSIAAKVIDYESIVNLMMSVKWDINDLMSQHNQYVDILLRNLQVFRMRLEELGKNFQMPHEAYLTLWESIIRITNRTLLEGFASARRCTNEGRSLMQLDYQQFLMKLEGMTSVKPIPDRHLVENYIKAYYLPENTIDDWILENQNHYSAKQLNSLISTMSHISKRTRQKIATILDESSAKKSI